MNFSCGIKSVQNSIAIIMVSKWSLCDPPVKSNISPIHRNDLMKNTTLLFMSRITLMYTDIFIIVTSLRLKLKADGY